MLLYTFRGIANKDLTPEVATKIALIEGKCLRQAVLEVTAERSEVVHEVTIERSEQENSAEILLAGDHRVSTPMLKSALTAGFLSVGLNVIDCGMLPTPVLSFIVKKLSLPGVMVTASHNPPEWNGFQFLQKDSHIYGPEEEERIKSMIESKLQLPDWQEIGGIKKREGCIDEYIAQLKKMVKPALERSEGMEKPIKVVVDFGGGMATVVVPKLLESLGIEFVEINSELDPFFKKRPSEPSTEVIDELREQVVKEKADAGFAYDGDADRVMVVDEEGNVVEGDKLIFLLCQEMLKPPGPVVLTADISMVVEKSLKNLGFEIIKNRWGQTFIGDTVRKNNATFGAETNDHYMFPDLSLHADSIAATAFFCSILSRSETKMSQMFNELPETHIYREKVNFTDDLTHHSTNIEAFFNQHFGHFEKLHPRLYLANVDESKLLIRQSPFDKYVRIFAESFHPKKTDEMIKQMKRVLGIT